MRKCIGVLIESVCLFLALDLDCQDYFQEIREEYTEMRAQHLKSVAEHKYVPLAKARARGLQTAWTAQPTPVRPSFLGTRVFKRTPLATLAPFIDWNPFFQVWQLRGKYPNRNYPKLFNDAGVGEQVRCKLAAWFHVC